MNALENVSNNALENIPEKNTSEKLIVLIHERTKKITSSLRQNQYDLISSLQDVDTHKVYRAYKYPSLIKYLMYSHGYSKDEAYVLIRVTRASLRFSKLNLALKNNEITISKAKRISSVLTQENQEEWLQKSKINSCESLEKLIAQKNPEALNIESSRYVSQNQIEIKVVMTEREFEALKRSQSLLCQKHKKPVSLKDTVVLTSREFNKTHDPVEKAKRIVAKKLQSKKISVQKMAKQAQVVVSDTTAKPPQQLVARPVLNPKSQESHVTQGRTNIPALTLHYVNLRDQGKCQDHLPTGEKCLESKWIDIHHIKHIKDGGTNALENLITLCKGHHQLEHWDDKGV